MYRIVAACAALAALVVVGFAQPSISSTASGGEDRLFGGGRFIDFDPGPNEFVLPREFSVQAESKNGKNGSGTRIYGNPDLPEPAVPNVISCLNADGGHAVVGGIDPACCTPYEQYFDDRSTAGKEPADGLTPVLNMSPEDVQRFMPKHFPRVCPSTTVPEEWNPAYFWTTLESGDIAVLDR